MAEGLKRQSANNVRERFRLTARRISPLKETRASVKLLHEALAIRPAQSGNAPALETRWVKMAAGAPRRSLNPRHLTEKETELFRTVIALGYRDRLGQECAALDCALPVELSARGERGQTLRSLVIRVGIVLTRSSAKASSAL
jgi:hypothetical protein